MQCDSMHDDDDDGEDQPSLDARRAANVARNSRLLAELFGDADGGEARASLAPGTSAQRALGAENEHGKQQRRQEEVQRQVAVAEAEAEAEAERRRVRAAWVCREAQCDALWGVLSTAGGGASLPLIVLVGPGDAGKSAVLRDTLQGVLRHGCNVYRGAAGNARRDRANAAADTGRREVAVTVSCRGVQGSDRKEIFARILEAVDREVYRETVQRPAAALAKCRRLPRHKRRRTRSRGPAVVSPLNGHNPAARGRRGGGQQGKEEGDDDDDEKEDGRDDGGEAERENDEANDDHGDDSDEEEGSEDEYDTEDEAEEEERYQRHRAARAQPPATNFLAFLQQLSGLFQILGRKVPLDSDDEQGDDRIKVFLVLDHVEGIRGCGSRIYEQLARLPQFLATGPRDGEGSVMRAGSMALGETLGQGTGTGIGAETSSATAGTAAAAAATTAPATTTPATSGSLGKEARSGSPVHLTCIWVTRTPTVLEDVALIADPIYVRFPGYTSAELLKILKSPAFVQRYQLEPRFASWYNTFVDMMLPSVFTATNNIRDLGRLCATLFPDFIQPVRAASSDAPQHQHTPEELFNRIRSRLRDVVRSPFLVPDTEDVASSVARGGHVSRGGEGDAQLWHARPRFYERSMPFYTRCLLVAAFLASHNPPESDIFTFTEEKRGRRRKKRRGTDVEGDEGAHDDDEAHLGRMFTLERLLSILTCVVSGLAGETTASVDRIGRNDLFAQLTLLARQQMLTAVDGAKDLLHPRFRCNIDLRTAEDIAKSLGMPLQSFLT